MVCNGISVRVLTPTHAGGATQVPLPVVSSPDPRLLRKSQSPHSLESTRSTTLSHSVLSLPSDLTKAPCVAGAFCLTLPARASVCVRACVGLCVCVCV